MWEQIDVYIYIYIDVHLKIIAMGKIDIEKRMKAFDCVLIFNIMNK